MGKRHKRREMTKRMTLKDWLLLPFTLIAWLFVSMLPTLLILLPVGLGFLAVHFYGEDGTVRQRQYAAPFQVHDRPALLALPSAERAHVVEEFRALTTLGWQAQAEIVGGCNAAYVSDLRRLGGEIRQFNTLLTAEMVSVRASLKELDDVRRVLLGEGCRRSRKGMSGSSLRSQLIVLDWQEKWLKETLPEPTSACWRKKNTVL